MGEEGWAKKKRNERRSEDADWEVGTSARGNTFKHFGKTVLWTGEKWKNTEERRKQGG